MDGRVAPVTGGLRWACAGVTSEVRCPGPIDPRLLHEGASSHEKLVRALIRSVLVGRVGKPTDVSGMVTFFAHERAEYVTDQTVSVGGGLSTV